MAYREVSVTEIREVLRLWLRGMGLHSIAQLVAVDRKDGPPLRRRSPRPYRIGSPSPPAVRGEAVVVAAVQHYVVVDWPAADTDR
jgi:hypothetical protein